MALRRHDLSPLIRPVQTDEAIEHVAVEEGKLERIKHRKLTREEVERGLVAMDRAGQHAKERLAARGGQLFPDSAELIHQMRQERTRELMEALGWDDSR